MLKRFDVLSLVSLPLLTSVIIATPVSPQELLDEQQAPLTVIPEIPADNEALRADECLPGNSDADPGGTETLTKQLQECGGVLTPPPTGDPDIQGSVPDPDPATTPVIPPEALPPQQSPE